MLSAQDSSSIGKPFLRDAIKLIKANSKVEQRLLKRNNFNVSQDVVSFDVFAPFFSAEDAKRNSKDSILLVVSRDPSLYSLGGKKSPANVKIFFSEIRGSHFFAEVMRMKSKNETKYLNRPNFGMTQIFFFNVLDGKVSLVSSEILNHM